METLGQIKPIADKIRTSSRPAIYALYRLVFKKDGDRTSRNQLRAFHGFDFDDTSDEFRARLEYSAIFSIGDLTSMCNILGLDYVGTIEELRQRIIRALMDIKSLMSHEDDDDVEVAGELQHQNQVEQVNDVDDQRTIADVNLSSSDADSRSSYRISTKNKRRNKTKIVFNFKDVEDTI